MLSSLIDLTFEAKHGDPTHFCGHQIGFLFRQVIQLTAVLRHYYRLAAHCGIKRAQPPILHCESTR